MTSQKAFASTGNLAEKKVSFTEVGPGLFAYTAEGDPNTGVIVGHDSCAVFDAQATPAMARQVIEKVRTVNGQTDQIRDSLTLPCRSRPRCVGIPGPGDHRLARDLSTYRRTGSAGLESEYGRFPRLFRDAQSIPGLT